MADNIKTVQSRRLLTTPRAAALAGILSGGLFIAVHLLLWSAIPFTQAGTGAVLLEKAPILTLTLALVPFAGIAFLWFIGVARDRIGRQEDQFFSTVFLGSGLLYLGMTFTAGAIGGGLLGSFPSLGSAEGVAVLDFSQATILQLTNVYGIRMAAVFMLSSATIWRETAVMPRWLSLLTYALSLVLLVLINFSLWVTLIFPAWMLVVSIMILVINYRRRPGTETGPLPDDPEDQAR